MDIGGRQAIRKPLFVEPIDCNSDTSAEVVKDMQAQGFADGGGEDDGCFARDKSARWVVARV